jgi:hypothetical protein
MNARGNDLVTLRKTNNSVWYLPGGGGNWLNYLIWCYCYNTHIYGQWTNFHQVSLQTQQPDYRYLLGVANHDKSWKQYKIIFGSHKSSLNMFINNCRKLGFSLDNAVERALLFQTTYDWSVGYNIQWHLIANDYKTFLEALSDALRIKITYTIPVKHAFQQYINSCWPIELQGDAWLNHPLTKAYIQALEIRGLPKQTVFDHWTKYSPLN